MQWSKKAHVVSRREGRVHFGGRRTETRHFTVKIKPQSSKKFDGHQVRIHTRVSGVYYELDSNNIRVLTASKLATINNLACLKSDFDGKQQKGIPL